MGETAQTVAIYMCSTMANGGQCVTICSTTARQNIFVIYLAMKGEIVPKYFVYYLVSK